MIKFSHKILALIFGAILSLASAEERPNIILIMTDDQGWGETSYNGHSVLKTPHLDAMAANGLRFDRFYAGAPVCSPTRASALTGRANDRCGVPSHGHALRLPEKTLASALKKAGYATGHFGKWHLNAIRGPGVPVLADDPYGPSAFGFDTWLTVTNFFDLDPVLGAQDGIHSFKGDSSAVIVDEAVKFITTQKEKNSPFLAVIWDGSPHSPFRASPADIAPFKDLDQTSQHHYGELVAFDRAVGKLRKSLRDLEIADNTLLWFCSDNGGLNKITPETVGGLRGHKSDLWEGGIRIPAIIEWPAKIKPRITRYPASTMDIFPTLADLLALPDDALLKPVDGQSLKPLFKEELNERASAIPFHFIGKGALIDDDFKLISTNLKKEAFALYHLKKDPTETTDVSTQHPERFAKMKRQYLQWYTSVQASIEGKDYPDNFDPTSTPKSGWWINSPRYQPFLKKWKQISGLEEIIKDAERRTKPKKKK
ncbi:MAG: sulfatase-like hydrolase/transferase [Akkermansiaceae bacterium]